MGDYYEITRGRHISQDGPELFPEPTPEQAKWLNFFYVVSDAVRIRKRDQNIGKRFKARIVDRGFRDAIKIVRTIEEYPGGAGFEWIWQVEQTAGFVKGGKVLDVDLSDWTSHETDRFTEVTFTIFKQGLVAYGRRAGQTPQDDEERLDLLTDEYTIRGLEHLALATVNGLII